MSLISNSLVAILPYDLSKVEEILKYQNSLNTEENKNI